MSVAADPALAHAALHYRVWAQDLKAHHFGVALTLTAPQADPELRLPVWIAGSYLVREFAKHWLHIHAVQDGRPVPVRQLDKHRWQLTCVPGRPVTVQARVYAHDDSVRTAWLSTERGFFNGTSLCLQVVGQEHLPHHLQLDRSGLPEHWQVACALQPLQTDAQGWGTYSAPDYDALVDAPVEFGPFWSGTFTAGGIPHRVVVAGAWPSFDGARLLADSQRVCEAALRFWHGAQPQQAPHDRYLFLINATGDGYGGLEHRHSTALLCQRADLPRTDTPTPPQAGSGYEQLLGLISHEYFHTWNVKRLRPAEFARLDYGRENHTELLWFFEGFTSYYDDLLVRRAGLMDDAGFLRSLAKTLNQVAQTPGRRVHSLAQASFEAWTKFYRPDANTPNTTVSYYGKGALVALCLDLSLRAGGHSLDAVMRGLWLRCAAGPMTEADLLAELQAQTGRDWTPELRAWVHGTEELPALELLQTAGVQVAQTPAGWAQRLGLKVQESSGSLRVQTVLDGSAAQAAGFSAGDEWLALELETATGPQRWRLRQLDDLSGLLAHTSACHAWVARDQRILSLPLQLPPPASSVDLRVGNATALRAWLAPSETHQGDPS